MEDVMKPGGGKGCQWTGDPFPATLTVASGGVQNKGSFKLASKAFCTPPIFDASSNRGVICAKQTYELEPWSKTVALADRALVVHGFEEQKDNLLMELAILSCADALLDHVYRLIEFNKPETPIEIPQFRFVSAALATEGLEVEEEKRQAYLLEEYIETPFIKYINNGLAKPLSSGMDDEDLTRAHFLCFTQHVQYTVTGKRAFVSDYQGRISCS